MATPATPNQGASNQEKDIHAVVPIPERLMKNKKVAILTADQTEDTEFFYPYYRLTEAGYTVDVVTAKGGAFAGKHGLGLKKSKAVSEVKATDYELLYIPGGKAPESLRQDQSVLKFVKEYAATGKPIAAICHGPQVLCAADLVKGKQLAGYPGIRQELEQAGATFVDEALVEDGQFITGRLPGDLHRHLYGVLQVLEGKQGEKPSAEKRNAA